ncbi:MAG: patatin-like phospholipase family protein [Silvibacterium sp.]|nr:patatin-like phospholipase family protein [Silvibacterium sp.]MBV8436577.1 patatin-like phospholipase family protein [Silvibacterium sp.]
MAILGGGRKALFAGVWVGVLAVCARGLADPLDGNAGNLPAATRPKLGLVLEGGGALGLAHIGVIQWLEEHRIPVSYVAGTSMGGLVGGLYATGRSPQEVLQLVDGINWDQVLRGVTPFNKLSYRRKEDAYQYPNQLEFGLRKGLRFPEGFNSGQEVSFILDNVALPYSEIETFDDLPIPFACVGTDLAMDKKHVFRSGSLAVAMRSTMSLPGIFSPVRDGDHLYADGGLVDNLPVDVAKEMGAEITLAVHLQVKPLNLKEPLSAFGVLGQSISTVVAVTELRGIEQADLVVSVPLDKYTSTDYKDSVAIIKAGYEAAQSKATMLSTLSVDEATWEEYLARRNSRRRIAPIPRFVQVEGTDKRSASGIEKAFASAVGKPVNSADVQSKLLDIQGDGRYSTLTYEMVRKGDEQGLEITTLEKPYAPPTVRPLIVIDGSEYNNVLFSIGARITFLDVGSYGAEWRNDVIFGTQYGITSEYYRPIHPGGRFFVAPFLSATSNEFNAYTSGGDLAALYRQKQAGGGFDFGYEFGRTSELRIGYQTSYYSYTLEVGEKEIEPQVSGRQGFSRIKYQLLRVDDPVIPTTGQLLNFRTQYFDANAIGYTNFTLTQGGFTDFIKLNELNSLYISPGGGTTYGNNAVGVPVFSLGGPLSFPAYGTNEILTNQYSILTLGYLRQLKELPPLLGNKLYFQGRFDVGSYETAEGGTRVPGDVSGALVVSTIFGPVVIGGSVGDSGHHRFYFGIGRVF